MKKSTWKKIWHFIWHDDSIWSWLVNLVIAFIVIKFIVYPVLGFILGTTFPIVAVVSSSMHHDGSFNTWWENAESQYEEFDINKQDFKQFPLKNGFNKGDIMFLIGTKEADIGDIIVFQANRPEPIIHRVVHKRSIDGKVYYQTKGDNYATNPSSLKTREIDETKIPNDSNIIKGKAVLRIPLLGYIKIFAVDLVNVVI